VDVGVDWDLTRKDDSRLFTLENPSLPFIETLSKSLYRPLRRHPPLTPLCVHGQTLSKQPICSGSCLFLHIHHRGPPTSRRSNVLSKILHRFLLSSQQTCHLLPVSAVSHIGNSDSPSGLSIAKSATLPVIQRSYRSDFTTRTMLTRRRWTWRNDATAKERSSCWCRYGNYANIVISRKSLLLVSGLIMVRQL
jgi:hypothetical protein